MDIIEFLTARLDEDEAAARAAGPGPWSATGTFISDDDGEVEDANGNVLVYHEGTVTRPTAEHIARHDPARVLSEVEAKRKIVEHHASDGDGEYPGCEICMDVGPDAQGWPCLTVRLLALPYSDHPDYDEDWRP